MKNFYLMTEQDMKTTTKKSRLRAFTRTQAKKISQQLHASKGVMKF